MADYYISYRNVRVVFLIRCSKEEKKTLKVLFPLFFFFCCKSSIGSLRSTYRTYKEEPCWNGGGGRLSAPLSSLAPWCRATSSVHLGALSLLAFLLLLLCICEHTGETNIKKKKSYNPQCLLRQFLSLPRGDGGFFVVVVVVVFLKNKQIPLCPWRAQMLRFRLQ